GPASAPRFARDELLRLGRLQALGELGRRREMLVDYGRLATADDDQDVVDRMSALRVAALCGAVSTVDLLAESLSASLPEDVARYWQLTARQVAGEDGVSVEFRRLIDVASPYLTSMIQRRIERPLPPLTPGELDEPAERMRERLVEVVAHETRYAVLGASSRRPPYATWSIAVILIAVFLSEVPGGSTNTGNLDDLGALIIPTSETPGEWWRILTAGVLHAGPLHLGLNLMGLFYLGSRLERAWGPRRMLLCYIVATIGSMGLAPVLMSFGQPQRATILVGASGGVMGLLGGILGHLATGWWKGRNRRVTRQLGIVLLLVTLQTFFDLTTPNVSFACHALGLVIGFLIALAFAVLDAWHPDASVRDTRSVLR
ncbi:MAG: rhomboid family intramembrane serine protease, partial [Planctomycetaceae bacterium]|nr:rhomboid family intramembrane serine protease [Planctomycetaceae bacterium]